MDGYKVGALMWVPCAAVLHIAGVVNLGFLGGAIIALGVACAVDAWRDRPNSAASGGER
jgi:hypothetical protein